MGQKTHPYGFRLGYNKPWRSRWFAGRDYADLLHEDVVLRRAAEGAAALGGHQLHRYRTRRQQAGHPHLHRAPGHHHRPQGRGNRQAQERNAEAHQARSAHRHSGSAPAGAGRATGGRIDRAAARKARGLPPRHAQGRGFGAAFRLQGHQGSRGGPAERRGNRAQGMVPARPPAAADAARGHRFWFCRRPTPPTA